MVSEVLQGFVGQGREHIAQVMAFHILLYLRVELSELAETSGDFKGSKKFTQSWVVRRLDHMQFRETKQKIVSTFQQN